MSRAQRPFLHVAASDVLEAPGAAYDGEAPVPPPRPRDDGPTFRPDVCADLELALARLRRNLGVERSFIAAGSAAAAPPKVAQPQLQDAQHRGASAAAALFSTPAAAGALRDSELQAAVRSLEARVAALDAAVGAAPGGGGSGAGADGGSLDALRRVVALLEPGAAEELAARVEATLEQQRMWRAKEAATFGPDKCAAVLQLLNALDSLAEPMRDLRRLAAHHRTMLPLHCYAVERFDAMYSLVADTEATRGALDFAAEEIAETSRDVDNNTQAIEAALQSFRLRLEAVRAGS